MKVLKFGGTSVGSAQRMKDVAKLITGERNIVVLSAMSGTTNSLVEISDYLYKKNPDGANEVINKLAQKYYGHIEELYSTDEYKQKAKELIKHHFDHIRTFTKDLFTLFEEKVVLAQGELISTGMMNLYLNECGINSVLIPALDYMRTDKNAEPDPVYIKEKLIKLLDGHKDADLFITQGYICRNAYGEIDNLQRGGSDYSASLIGAAIGAEEIQIWTDIDGMHNNDPRIVEKTSPVRHLHFEEAAELAYFGAKILHPTCILPAKLNNIPVRLLNTMQPEALQHDGKRENQSCRRKRQYHFHQDQEWPYAVGYRIPTKSIRNIRKLPDAYRHGNDFRSRCFRYDRQPQASGRDRGRPEKVWNGHGRRRYGYRLCGR